MASILTKDEQWVLDEKYLGLRDPEFEADRGRLACGEPVAYVIGWQPFLGLKIYLESRPLIPRPETEWWTEQLLTNVGRLTSHIRALDLCAGSGAIGCAMLKAFPTAQVYFGEIDPAHEATIRKNIAMNGLDTTRAHIGIGDLFAPFSDQTFDIVACNPPYIPAGRELPASVAEYEPAGALYAGTDGLNLIRRIATELPYHLTPGGQAWIECDISNSEAAQKLFATARMQSEVIHDQYGVPRIVVVTSS